ncbi:MAG: phosphate/phosphite/phosphonate ABC transporter substrate-binding protein, partial [Gammaproteobacteria bacterium]|nr:phosphate/phosphite/phosphonate ABC transporter substrate-binding protein [Gammaproteobacteria bacterium]
MRRIRLTDVTAVLVGLCWMLSVASEVRAETRAADAASKAEYVMGIFPHLPPRAIEEIFGPMAKDLTAHIGRPVILASSTTFEKFSENLGRHQYDIAFVQPFEYVKIADQYGYVPLATRTESLSGLIVTTLDSPLKTLADLKGKRLALPPESAAISYLVRLHLKSKGLVAGKEVFISHQRSHISCMQQVIIGEADACGTAAPSIRYFQNKMQVEL